MSNKTDIAEQRHLKQIRAYRARLENRIARYDANARQHAEAENYEGAAKAKAAGMVCRENLALLDKTVPRAKSNG